MEYNFSADLLNKFTMLTPWIQAIIGLAIAAVLISPFYFLKEIVRVIVDRNKEPEKEWRDKFYRDEKIKG